MLSVKDDFEPVGFQITHRIGDHAQVFFERRLKRASHLLVPRLADDRRHRRPACDQVGQPGIFIGRNAFAARRAERHEPRMGKRAFAQLREECDILRVRGWKTAFDIVDAKFVETPGNPQLVFKRKRNALRLLTIPQRRVVCNDLRHETLLYSIVR